MTVQFAPIYSGATTGTLNIASNSSNSTATIVSLGGTGTSLSTIACDSATMTSAGSVPCTLTLSGPAPIGGLNLSVSSSSKDVTVPASSLVQSNATTAGFTATVSTFSSTQTVTLTATSGSVSKTFEIQLNVSNTSSIFVDSTKGSDAGTGTQASPLKTIQAAVTKANAINKKATASTIIVNPGVYRELVKISTFSGLTNAPLTIQAASAGSAIIAGSDVMNNWISESGNPNIYSSPWQYRFGACAIPSGWSSDIEPIALRTEMLFVDNEPLTQVMAASELQPGTFYVDEAHSLLHAYPPAGTNMQTALVEAAVRANTLNVSGRSNVTVRGLVFRHANTCVNRSSANISSSSSILVDQVQALWNSWGGLGVYSSTGVTVQNSIASYNGGVGFVASRDQNSLYSFNESDYNNWRGAQAAFYDWAMGGTKLFAMHGATVRNHFSYNNQGQGLWFDTDNKNIIVDNATLVGNLIALQIERNEGPVTLQNSHLCSNDVGVNMLTSEKVTIRNNAFYNNGGINRFQAQIYLAGQAGGIYITDWQTGQVYDLFTTGLIMSGNSFEDGAPGQKLFGTYVGDADWAKFATSLNSGNNSWYDSSTPTSFKMASGKLVNLAGWQSAVGTDYTSVWSPSSSSVVSACNAPATHSYIDFHVTVDSKSYAMTSGKAVVVVRVDSFGAGAVALRATGLPSGVTASISEPNLVSGVLKVTLSASAGAVTQTVPITIWGVGTGRLHSVRFQLAVAP
jgi:Right handed beta helix region